MERLSHFCLYMSTCVHTRAHTARAAALWSLALGILSKDLLIANVSSDGDCVPGDLPGSWEPRLIPL